MPGPDHKASLDLKNFKIFWIKLDKLMYILGKNKKFIQKEEKQMMKVSRKGLYFRSSLADGKRVKKIRPNCKTSI